MAHSFDNSALVFFATDDLVDLAVEFTFAFFRLKKKATIATKGSIIIAVRNDGNSGLILNIYTLLCLYNAVIKTHHSPT